MSIMPRLRKPDLKWKLHSGQILPVGFPVAQVGSTSSQGGLHYCLHTEITPLVLRLRAQTETKSLPLLGLQLPIFGSGFLNLGIIDILE